jgi:hypothetical protein
MLRRAAAIGLALLASTVLTMARANADDHPIHVKGDNDGVISTSVQSPGSAPQANDVSTSSSPREQTCVWMQVGVFERLPLPAVMGGVKGSWWDQYCNNNGWKFTPVFVPDNAPQAALRVSPGALAQRAVNQLQLPSPSVGLDPRGRALVNLPEWFWIPPAQWRPLTQRTRAGAVWALVTARPVSTSWDPGDGSQPFSCDGPGTPYDASRSAAQQTSDCSYSYQRSSAAQPQSGPDPNDRFFTVTVTTTWSVSWVGAGGTGGALPAMTRSTSFDLAVAQRESVVTGGSG